MTKKYSFLLFEDVDWTAEDTAELKRRRAEEAKKPDGGRSMNEIRDEIYSEKVAAEAKEKQRQQSFGSRARAAREAAEAARADYEETKRKYERFNRIINNVDRGIGATTGVLALNNIRCIKNLSKCIKEISKCNTSEDIKNILAKYYNKIFIFSKKIDFSKETKTSNIFNSCKDTFLKCNNFLSRGYDISISKKYISNLLIRLRNIYMRGAISLGVTTGLTFYMSGDIPNVINKFRRKTA